MQRSREIKTDDIYIYHVYALSLLLTMFQKEHRQARLCFLEGEDDEDMATSDMVKYSMHGHLFSCDF